MSARHFRFAVASTAVVALSLVAAGCAGSVSGPGSASSPTPPGVARELHRLFPGLRVRYGGVARLAGATPPASAALPGANDLLVAGRSAPFADTAGGSGGSPPRASTVIAATGLGIWRSADGGASWRRVLAGVSAWSLTAAASGGYAAIGNLPARRDLGPAALATSADGVHWQVRDISAPRAGLVIPLGSGYRIAMSGIGPNATGVASSDVSWAFYAGPALRSTDGGRTWRRIGGTLPAGVFSTPAMTDGGRTVFLTAPGRGPACAGAVYRSVDAGATWSLLRGSCEPYPLTAVQFVSASKGFAAGGLGYKAGGALVAESTSDGGRTWRTLARTRAGNGAGPPAQVGIVRLDMVSARVGWAIAGGCEGGANGPCDGAVVTTADGGAHWRTTSQPATSLVGLDPAGSAALAGDTRSTVLASTADGGRSWTPQAPPRWVATSAFAGAGSSQVWATNLGDFLSTSAGSAWAGAGQLRTARYAYESWLAGGGGRLLGYTESMHVVVSADAGHTFAASRVPDHRAGDVLLTAALGAGGAAIAVTGAGAQCLSAGQARQVRRLKPGWKPPPGASTLFASADGGAHWAAAGSVLPFGVGMAAAASVDGAMVAIVDACNRLQVSTDGGTSWRGEAIGKTVFCVVSGLARELWLTCQSGLGGCWVLHSADAGATWTALWLRAAAAVNGMSLMSPGPGPVINPGGAFATGPDAAVMPAGGSLWRTADGGASWRQSWPAL